MEERFLLDRIYMQRTRLPINKAVKTAPLVLPDAAKPPAAFRNGTTAGTQHALDKTVFEPVIKRRLVKIALGLLQGQNGKSG
jgi:hypothetical protein